ncbi:hypothetical protein [Streptomyces paromomycinus]|uniref:Uncharacterized protein n=1 Tax=Streptomyces paromomycinus TaxID=92743 RepID=A0A401VY06_STREY|nr:hypothetical protein [Streptomyces paromomycinus]GCD41915.1 hypothetical protein GKJPGBOP_01573 [Streptomyces paromomycinus]
MSQQRSGITKYVSNVLDDTKTMIDDVIDKVRDFETDARDSISRNLGTKDTKTDIATPQQPGTPPGQETETVTRAEAAALYTRLGQIEELLRQLQPTSAPAQGTAGKTAGKSST